MQGGFESNTRIFQIMQVEYFWVLKYSNNVNDTNNASNYLHYLHDFICDIHMILIFDYFESNNNPMQVMQGGFELSISAMWVMRVFKSRWGGSYLTRPSYVSIWEYSNISNFEYVYPWHIDISIRL